MNNQVILYRRMDLSDVPVGLALSGAAGWNQTENDWEFFIRENPFGNCVATDRGRIVGTVTTVRYQDHFSWIGMVLVKASHQRQGIGLQLVKEALIILDQDGCVKLDATPAGREVYLKLGFADEYQLKRMEAKPLSIEKPAHSNAKPMQHSDFGELLMMDQDVFGANREPLLRRLFNEAPEYSFVSKYKNEINGYCFGRKGPRFIHIGPVIAHDLEGAKNVISAVLRNNWNLPVIVDVLSVVKDWESWLTSNGFKEQRQFIRMVRGSNSYPGLPKNQFAILGPEFG